jgi:curved DNA-binding protein CbpA
VAPRNYYALLDIPASASADDIKRAFRQQIARYHPDKVQHLGKEFQSLAAERAAELTEAYRILSDDGQRADYDRTAAESGGLTPAPFAAAAPRSGASVSDPRSAVPPPPSAPAPAAAPTGGQFRQERASRDEFVRKATLGRFRQALAVAGGDYDEAEVRGFDIACVPKPKFFGRSRNPRLLGRFVPQVDRAAVADAWASASKWGDPRKDEVCVLLMGTSLASIRELAGEIAEQRRKSRGARLTLIPVDANAWDAHMPLDAPAIAKALIARLKTGA